MKLGLIGASYKTTPVEKREKLAVSDIKVPEVIRYLKGRCKIEELMVLSTCNRVELYFVARNSFQEMANVQKAFLDYLGLPSDFDAEFYHLVNRDAIIHLFRVASSLESMVIGEPQILGQLKNAFLLSVNGGGCAFLLNKLMHKAFSAAKLVRSDTGIAKFAVSISFAAVEMAKKIFDELNAKTILIIGAGEMAELAVSHLMKAGCSRLMVANRTFSRAVSLAEQFQGSAVRFEALDNHLELADIIISSTGAKGFLIDKAMVLKATKKRKNNPLFFIDIAVPRDIDPEINTLNNVYAYDIDDLQSVVDANLLERQSEGDKAHKILLEEMEGFDKWLSTLKSVPTIKALREHVLGIANQELEKGLQQLSDLTSKQEKAVRSIVNAFANKILHKPTIILRNNTNGGEFSQEYAQIIQELFDLNIQDEDNKPNNIIELK